MNGEWLSKKLYSINEKIRVELGPQLIEMICSVDNLSDDVTSPHYRVGMRDALGRIIMPEQMSSIEARKLAEADPFGTVNNGEKMSVIDWREKHAPSLWKVYQVNESGRFIKVDEFEDMDEAIARADLLFGEM